MVSARQIQGASSTACAGGTTTVLLRGLQCSVSSSRFSQAGASPGGSAATPLRTLLPTLGCRLRAVGAARAIGVDGHLGRRRRRDSEGVQGVGRPVSTPSAPAHGSWRPEPRQRSRSRPASPKPPATSVRSHGGDPAGARRATRAKRRREGGGRSGARTPTRAEPAGEAGRAWEPGAPVAGPPPATAECPRCLPAGLPRKALSLRQPPRHRLPAPRPYNPPSRSPPRSPARRQRCSPALGDTDARLGAGRQRWDPS